jgi:MFS family permease
VALVVLGGSTQIFFLPAILPEILPGLGIPSERTLEVGGLVIFASGVAAALGAVAAPRLAEMLPERRLLALLLVASSASVLALVLAPTAPLYGALRFLQMLFIAPVFPIVVARVAQSAGGEAIGVVNAARIGAAFVGPVVATTVLAWTGPSTLYALLALIGLASLPLAAARDAGPRRLPSGTP